MIKRILILGGYGNFGRFIAKCLARDEAIQLILAGRHIGKAKDLARRLNSVHFPETVYCDIQHNLNQVLEEMSPDVVIHTSGPFQKQGYQVPEACIKNGCHYIDLADARDYVANIEQLDIKAKANNLLLVSGASSVPGLSSAIIEHYLPQFYRLESIEYAIATAQLTNQGLATTAGVLSYAGKPFFTLKHGEKKVIYGWQGLRLKKFWHLNRRLLGNCDIPDLDLFPKCYPRLKNIKFQAGLELKVLHLGLYFLSWFVRLNLLPSLDRFASFLLKFSRWFDVFGHNNTGFYMLLQGKNAEGIEKKIQFDLYAEKGDGLYIPCMPAVLLAKKLTHENLSTRGAMACVGLVSLQEYLDALKNFGLDIIWRENMED
ncbi:saccharopine dehydrogenase family protein [Legionella londiniensis]|uniref:Saccharopine dehydrogenase n=1 Tax=Legionella londiniensis TaxID=45068 RepID=A0A0W0VQU6_9GAMM|nr:saccharopine dehydrogenase NADP-binding domain-containing protein [Legionella londiniensis]KTD22535.1 Saccharopine dehydrogenase [Legionella londiniensis]STX92466.1 Saccharopine dehydrogenase [Legionella londiniensis]